MSHLDDVIARQQPPTRAALEAENARLHAALQTAEQANVDVFGYTWQSQCEGAHRLNQALVQRIETAEQEIARLQESNRRYAKANNEMGEETDALLAARDRLVVQWKTEAARSGNCAVKNVLQMCAVALASLGQGLTGERPAADSTPDLLRCDVVPPDVGEKPAPVSPSADPHYRSGRNEIEGPFLMPPILLGAGPAQCRWQLEDEDADSYRTACGKLWEFTVGSPAENQARFCPYCGRPLTVGPLA